MGKKLKLSGSNYLFPWIIQLLNEGYDMHHCLNNYNISMADLHLNKYNMSAEQHTTMIQELIDIVGEQDLIQILIANMDISHHGILGLLALCGTSLRQVAYATLRFYPLRSKIINLFFFEENNIATVRVTPTIDLQNTTRFVMEMALRTFLITKQQLIGPQDYQDHIYLPYAKPCEHDIYDSLHDDMFIFEHDYYQLTFPSSHLNLKLIKGNKKSYKTLQTQCEECLKALGDSASITEKVSYLLLNSTVELPGLSEMAKLLNISVRSLTRHLQKEGHSYQYYIDTERVRRAKYFLKESHLSIANIAANLHFSDSSHFSKVFKTHANMTPRQYRESII